MNKEELVRKLRSYLPGRIEFKKHADKRSLDRDVSDEKVMEMLSSSTALLDFQEQVDRYPNRRKFRLIYELNKRDRLFIVVSLNDILEVMTIWPRWR